MLCFIVIIFKKKKKKVMNYKRTLPNTVMIKLDAENTSIKLKNGFTLYVDDTYERERNITVTGIVYGLPSYLRYTGVPNKGMPWDCDMEVELGDHVVVYYLAVVNALNPQFRKYIIEDGERYVFVSYENIYCKYGDDFITPINGYILVEPSEDPAIQLEKERMKKVGLERVVLNTQSNTKVSYGIVRYVGNPNRGYCDPEYTDEGVKVTDCDLIMLKKINDIPLQYPLHSKIDGGKLFWRVQRRNILGKL